jgi:hypothetical protein
MVRTVLGLGTLTAGVMAYLLSGVNRVEAVVLPVVVIGVLGFGAALYHRARSRQEWSAAWDAYAEREVSRDSSGVPADHEIFSWAGAN